MSAQSEALQTRLIDFGIAAGQWAARLEGNSATKNVANQLARAAMSPAANYSEAQQAESRRDFLHKMQICLKELCETEVWLRATVRLGHGNPQSAELLRECRELIAIFVASVKTTKAGM